MYTLRFAKSAEKVIARMPQGVARRMIDELKAIAAAVEGGTSFTGGIGSIPGTFIGAVIIGTLDKGLNQAGVHFSYQYILKGLVIITAVYFDVRRKRG